MTGREAIELAIAKADSAINETQKQVAVMQGVVTGFQKQREQLVSILNTITAEEEKAAQKKRKK